jgi:glucosamine--fructose-6-phosphate aminotransferase (isomerizing)
MCGIIGIVTRPSERPAPTDDELLTLLRQADAATSLAVATEDLVAVDRLLHGTPGIQALIGRPALVEEMTTHLDRLDARAARRERAIEDDTALSPDDLEGANAELMAFRDMAWAIRHDRFRTARAVEAFTGRDAGPAAVAGFLAIQQALSAIDRMEVRGRDSAGLHLFVWNHGLAVDDAAVTALLERRTDDPLFQNGSVRVSDGSVGFVYKAAAEIGELGDNTAALRAAIGADPLLQLLLRQPDSRISVLGHTRWASVGIISEANCHPVNSDEAERRAVIPAPTWSPR